MNIQHYKFNLFLFHKSWNSLETILLLIQMILLDVLWSVSERYSDMKFENVSYRMN